MNKKENGIISSYIYVCKREIKRKGNSTKPKGACPNTLNYFCFLETLIMKSHEIQISIILFASSHFHHAIFKFYMKICGLITN